LQNFVTIVKNDSSNNNLKLNKMTEIEKQKLKSILNTLSHISYNSLIEIRKLKDVEQSKIDELENYKEALEKLIEELF
jgi:hypothetical protein